MKKISINMLSSADKVPGQGVGSAYIELINLLNEKASDKYDIHINKGTKYDILHAHTVDLQNYFKLKKTKGKKVAYVHFLPDTLDGSIKLPKFAFRIFKNYVISFYKQADKLVVVNPIFKKDMIRHGLDEEKIVYIPNFVSKEDFYNIGKSNINAIKKEYGFKKDDFIVLGAGQVQTRKGILDFINVAKKMPDVKFVWAGGFSFGPMTDGYAKLKKIMDNPPSNVKFLGIVDRSEMNNIYNMADILFVPSYNELFPMTILEALSTDTPIVLRDLDLYEDILFKKYLKGKNNKEFIEIINNLKTNKKAYNEAVKNSIEISKFYSKENVLEMWNKFYTELYNEK